MKFYLPQERNMIFCWSSSVNFLRWHFTSFYKLIPSIAYLPFFNYATFDLKKSRAKQLLSVFDVSISKGNISNKRDNVYDIEIIDVANEFQLPINALHKLHFRVLSTNISFEPVHQTNRHDRIITKFIDNVIDSTKLSQTAVLLTFSNVQSKIIPTTYT